ncbi:hypothetical protein DYBT9275_04653 [Dyadobacter sp. CECT 9275]|uniref:Alpha/beta hydrolase n=1 Tax=Dyadobacter helix TaxID=2822344 RepID=A0A916JGY5_9BACT|nr:alpha/beta hydrolase-fold protein [Dyadobacter sp. CECT 9275]CAG5010144.1 hypothetical protein DYBT9275_04653 [Dyadobacter sp. CECT 9275]
MKNQTNVLLKAKLILMVFVGTFLTVTLLAQPQMGKHKEIKTGEILTLHSKILQEEREIYINKPPGYDTLTGNLPVIYVLDAEYRFALAQSIISYFYITTKIPKVLIVGISNPNPQARKRDYLPAKMGGESKNFTDFLSTEVFPFIEKNFKTSGVRYIAGHSHGGIFVVHTLLTNPSMFDGYLATDPSLKNMYSETDTLLRQNLDKKRLYLASSDVAYGFMEDVAADMQADFSIFRKYLYQSHDQNHLKFKTEHLNDDHGNSYIQGFSRGLRYILNWRFE